jgi:hypothetical protein
MVVAYAGIEDVENSIIWLQRWINQQGYWFPRNYLLEHPRLDFLRGSSGYRQLVNNTNHLP